MGLAVYFPRLAVSQEDLETLDGTPPGKYTVGLGQSKMAVAHDCEDVVSMCLTVLQRLIERYALSYKDIGRLEVGTETIIDKSKSIKSSLMQLFESSGNYDVEGLDTTNACYGSTAALFNTVAWVESTAWDGRYGVVVAGDIAVYSPGPARATGGAGAVALLVGSGRCAPIRFEIGLRASCFQNTYDFYKPNMYSEYPVVNGAETVDCFVRAIDSCYSLFRQRVEKRRRTVACSTVGRHCNEPLQKFCVENDVDYCIFHSPFNKMVQRALARLVYNDFMDMKPHADQRFEEVEKYRSLPRETSHQNREAMRDFVMATKAIYDEKCEPGVWLSREVGNAYTASLYMSLAALIVSAGRDLVGRRILMFAFGSGFASSMFSLRVVGPLDGIVESLQDIEKQLNDRTIISADVYTAAMSRRELIFGRTDYEPQFAARDLYPGTFYLSSIDDQGRRRYERTEIS